MRFSKSPNSTPQDHPLRGAIALFSASIGVNNLSGVDAMSRQSRSLVLAVFLVSVFAVVQAAQQSSPTSKATRWSDAATWPAKKVPAAGEKVTIPSGKEVIL